MKERENEGERQALAELGWRIVRLRKARGWTRPELARLLGVSRERLGNWERGENIPTCEGLIALRRELGVSIDELVMGEPAPVSGFSREQKYKALAHLASVMKMFR